MASTIATIKRSDWAAVLSTQTGIKAEDIDKIDRALPGVLTQMALSKINDEGAKTVLAETGLCALKINYKESGEKTNADGTKTKIGPHVTVQYAVPKAIIQDLNKGLVVGAKLAKAAPAVGKIIQGVKSLAA